MTKPKMRRSGGAADKRHGFRGVPSERLREQAVARRPRASVNDPVVPPSQAGIRAAIESQVCPFCGRGPFKMLPVHTNKIHGIDKWELRDLAGFTTSDALCSEEVLAKMSDAYNRESGVLARATAASMQNRTSPRRTAAGIAKNTATLANWEAKNPEKAVAARRAPKNVTPEGRARRIAAVKDFWAANPDEGKRRVKALQTPEAQQRHKEVMAAKKHGHGTVACYSHQGCRCEPCRAAKAASRKKAKA